MSVLFGVLNIARNALAANQRALAVTAQNIANVNTRGYARQEVIFGSSATVAGEVPTDHQGPLGMGVLINDIRRAGGSMNTVLEERIAAGESNLGRLNARNEVSGKLESILNDASATGLNRVISNFFNAVQDVINDPNNIPARKVLLERARTLSERFVTADAQIQQVSADTDTEVGQLVREVNDQIKQIADFNNLIATATSSGLDTNELRNQRRLVMNDLAEKIGFKAVEDPLNLGKVTITIDTVSGSVPIVLVNSGNSQNLSSTRDLTISDITTGVLNGRLGGLANMRDVIIPALNSDLDQLASTFITNVNTRHAAGFDLLGETGVNFFSGTSADTMGVVISDPDAVAASSLLAPAPDPQNPAIILPGLPGNNQVMRDIAVLQNTLVINPVDPDGVGAPTATLQEFYNSIIAELGAGAQSAQDTLSAENVVQDELVSLKDSTSGVSLDNELINVTKYQRAFEAAARLVNVADEMLVTLIGLKR